MAEWVAAGAPLSAAVPGAAAWVGEWAVVALRMAAAPVAAMTQARAEAPAAATTRARVEGRVAAASVEAAAASVVAAVA